MDDQNRQNPDTSGIPGGTAPDFWRDSGTENNTGGTYTNNYGYGSNTDNWFSGSCPQTGQENGAQSSSAGGNAENDIWHTSQWGNGFQSDGEDPFWSQEIRWDNSGGFANRQPDPSGAPNPQNEYCQKVQAENPQTMGNGQTAFPYEAPRPDSGQPHVYASVNAAKKSGGLAIACLVLGIFGFFSGIFLIGLVLDVVAVILGIVALTNGYPKKGCAVTGLILSILSIVTTVLVYIAASGGFSSSKDPYFVKEPHIPSTDELLISDELMEQVSCTDSRIPSGIVLTFRNLNPKEVDFSVIVTYFDEDGDLVSRRNGYLWACAASGGEAALLVSAPHDRDYEPLPYDHYSVEIYARSRDYFNLDSPVITNYSKDIVVEADRSSDRGVLASITSNAPVPITDLELVCVFYQDGKPVGFASSYLHDYMEGQTEEFYAPYDEEYNAIEYDDFRVFVNRAESDLETE